MDKPVPNQEALVEETTLQKLDYSVLSLNMPSVSHYDDMTMKAFANGAATQHYEEQVAETAWTRSDFSELQSTNDMLVEHRYQDETASLHVADTYKQTNYVAVDAQRAKFEWISLVAQHHSVEPFDSRAPFAEELDPFAGQLGPFADHVDPFTEQLDERADPFDGHVDPFVDRVEASDEQDEQYEELFEEMESATRDDQFGFHDEQSKFAEHEGEHERPRTVKLHNDDPFQFSLYATDQKSIAWVSLVAVLFEDAANERHDRNDGDRAWRSLDASQFEEESVGDDYKAESVTRIHRTVSSSSSSSSESASRRSSTKCYKRKSSRAAQKIEDDRKEKEAPEILGASAWRSLDAVHFEQSDEASTNTASVPGGSNLSTKIVYDADGHVADHDSKAARKSDVMPAALTSLSTAQFQDDTPSQSIDVDSRHMLRRLSASWNTLHVTQFEPEGTQRSSPESRWVSLDATFFQHESVQQAAILDTIHTSSHNISSTDGRKTSTSSTSTSEKSLPTGDVLIVAKAGARQIEQEDLQKSAQNDAPVQIQVGQWRSLDATQFEPEAPQQPAAQHDAKSAVKLDTQEKHVKKSTQIEAHHVPKSTAWKSLDATHFERSAMEQQANVDDSHIPSAQALPSQHPPWSSLDDVHFEEEDAHPATSALQPHWISLDANHFEQGSALLEYDVDSHRAKSIDAVIATATGSTRQIKQEDSDSANHEAPVQIGFDKTTSWRSLAATQFVQDAVTLDTSLAVTTERHLEEEVKDAQRSAQIEEG